MVFLLGARHLARPFLDTVCLFPKAKEEDSVSAARLHDHKGMPSLAPILFCSVLALFFWFGLARKEEDRSGFLFLWRRCKSSRADKKRGADWSPK